MAAQYNSPASCKKVLLVNLPFEKIYSTTNFNGIAPSTPPLSLACIGGSLLKNRHAVKIFDFNTYEDGLHEFEFLIKSFQPDFIGITFVTPLIKEAEKLCTRIRKILPSAILIGGGAHSSSFPESALNETGMDIIVIGEGDLTILEIVQEKPYSEIKGIGFRKNGRVILNAPRKNLDNLDELPFPAHELYNIHAYKVPTAIGRRNPVGWMETSRGCLCNCVYCNKSCFGRTFRAKSPERVAQEFLHMQTLGFKEIHLTDDNFSTNINRAKALCDILIERKINLPWVPITGLRVDRIDFELLQKMKNSGCYKILFGIESGNQKILNRIKKGITLDKVREAVMLTKKAGMEVAGAFMIGLPGETEETMQDTINFAKSIKLDYAKISITIPLPATELFNELESKGLIKTRQWEDFKFYSVPSAIYDHENLSWATIERYYNKFYRAIYLNPLFILKRLKYSIVNKTITEDIRTALSIIRW